MTLAELRQYLTNANVRAFARVLREGESLQTDDAYRIRYNGNGPRAFFDSFADHPRILVAIPNDPQKRKSSAAGAFQFTMTTWDSEVKPELDRMFGRSVDFSPSMQEAGLVVLLSRTGQGAALRMVVEGKLDEAIALCRGRWTSLPGAAENKRVTFAVARAVYEKYGGTYGPAVPTPPKPAAPIEDKSTTYAPPAGGTTRKDATMGALALLQLFGPVLSGLIPQIASILKPESEVAKRNVDIAQTLVDTIVKASGADNLQGAVEKMQAEPEVKAAVQKAVVTEPAVLAVLEIGGGVKAAREADHTATQADKPFWFSPVFWISMVLLPMVYWYVGSSVVGGIEIPSDWPWYAQLPLKMFGIGWSLDARSGLANLVLGLVLGGICGVYFGVSVTQKNVERQTDQGGGKA